MRDLASLVGKRHGLYFNQQECVIRRVEEQLESLVVGEEWFRLFEAWE